MQNFFIKLNPRTGRWVPVDGLDELQGTDYGEKLSFFEFAQLPHFVASQLKDFQSSTLSDAVGNFGRHLRWFQLHFKYF